MTMLINIEILKYFYKEIFGGEPLNPFISYTYLKNKHTIQVIDLRFQVDPINLKKKQIFEEKRGATNKPRLFMILIRHRENKMIPDGNKFTEVIVI